MKLILTAEKEGIPMTKTMDIKRKPCQIENEEQWEAHLVELIKSCFPNMQIECVYE